MENKELQSILTDLDNKAITKHQAYDLILILFNVMPSCLTCYYSNNGERSCDRHLNKLKPDYLKGVECKYNNYAHYRPFKA